MKEKELKVIVAGDATVGKTSLMYRLTKNEFKTEESVTVVSDTFRHNVFLNDNYFSLVIYDTSGQERFRALTQSFYRHCVCGIFVYSVNDRDSFDNLKDTITYAREVMPEKSTFILVGNKTDLERKVTYDEGLALFKELNLHLFLETSAMTGDGTQTMLAQVVEQILESEVKSQMLQDQIYDISNKIGKIKDGKESERKCC